jgi:hypothetical protein
MENYLFVPGAGKHYDLGGNETHSCPHILKVEIDSQKAFGIIEKLLRSIENDVQRNKATFLIFTGELVKI